MAIAIDVSSPIRFTGTPANDVDITSASFTPPSDSLLVACVSADTNGSSDNITISVSGGSLTWTNRVERDPGEVAVAGHASIWTAVQTASTPMTVSARRTAGNGSTGRISVKVYVVTGADVGGTPTGATGENNSTTNNITPNAYTSTANNSRGFGCATDWNQLGTPTSTDTEDGADYSGAISVVSLFKAADTPTSGSTVTMNFDAGGTSDADWQWVALEILPSTGPEPQFARPDSDVSTGGWTTTTLFSKVDETTPDDGDLITSGSGPSNDICELGLSNVTDPSASTGHKLRVRRKKSAASGNQIDMRYRLLQGATEKASFTDDTNISEADWTTAERTLSGAQADSITDYTDLRIEIRANQVAGAGAAPTYEGRGAPSSTATSGANVTPGLPTGHQLNDILLVICHHSGALGWTTPTDWSVIAGVTGRNDTLAQNVAVFWKRHDGSETAPSISLESPDNVNTIRIAVMHLIRGCVTTGDPFDTGSGAGPTRLDDSGNAVIDTTSITTTVDNCLSVFLGAYEDDPASATTPGGGYSAPVRDATATGTDCSVWESHRTLSGTDTENPATTLSGGTFANSPHCGILIAFKPAAPPDVAAQVSWVEFEVPGIAGTPVSSDVTTDAAITATFSANVTTDAAISRSEQIDVTTDAAISQSVQTEVTTDAALSQTGQSEVTTDASITVSVASSSDVTTDAATTRTEQSEVTSDAAVSQSVQAEVTTDAAVSQSEQSEVTTDASITVSGVANAEVTTDAVITRTEQSEVTTDGAISQSVQAEVTTDAALSRTEQAEVATDASVTVAGSVNTEVETTAATTRVEQGEVPTDAALSVEAAIEVETTAATSQTEQAEVDADAAISQSAQSDIATNAAISIQGQVLLEVETSAAIGPPASLLIDDRTLSASWVDSRTLESFWIDSRTLESNWIDNRIIQSL